jgi:hypothetical protein
LARRHFPNASCAQIGTLLAKCLENDQYGQKDGPNGGEEENEAEMDAEDDEAE